MSLVITVVLISWFASALIRSSEAKKQAKREARIRAEQKRQREELRQQREDAKEWARQQVEIQREQMRLAKEQERQAKELERHEAWLVKHEAEIRKLKSRMTTAEMQINRYRGLLRSQTAEMNNLDARYGEIAKELDEIESLPFATKSEARVKELRKEKERLESKMKTLDNQLFSSKLNLKKATDVYNDMRIRIREVA